jgi:dTDP-4-amino-4,6-dideoxygalactose transaminase
MSTVISPSSEAIPFLDLVSPHRELEEEIMTAVRKAIRSAGFIGGPEVAGFEEEFARFTGAPHAIGVANGTDALRFAYIAAGVRPGDEIITVPNTFIATTETITQVGGVVKFVDVDERTMLMDPDQIEAAITPRTVGLVPVHLYGHPADMDRVLAIADKRKLWVIEDAAQAQGAAYRGRPAGSMGLMAGFSFYPGKNLGACGEAGAITAQRQEHVDVIRQLREHGQAKKYYHDIEGYNGRLDALQAAILRIKLRRLDEWNEGRRRAASAYADALRDVSEVTLPVEESFARHVYHLFVIRVERRDELQQHLAKRQIGTGLHYPLPLHLQKAYEGRGWRRGQFPVTENSAERLLSLPMFPELNESQIDRITSEIRAFFRG